MSSCSSPSQKLARTTAAMTSSFGWSLPSAAIATTEAHLLSPWSARRKMACWTDSMGRRNPQAAVRRWIRSLRVSETSCLIEKAAGWRGRGRT